MTTGKLIGASLVSLIGLFWLDCSGFLIDLTCLANPIRFDLSDRLNLLIDQQLGLFYLIDLVCLIGTSGLTDLIDPHCLIDLVGSICLFDAICLVDLIYSIGSISLTCLTEAD